MMNGYLLIIGNGFDLDLGLHTRYSDFWACEKWKSAREALPEPYVISSLEKYRITHNWFDLETGLLYGAMRQRGILFSSSTIQNYKESFHILVNELKDYVLGQQEHFIIKKDSVAKRLLDAIAFSEDPICIYTFNYTDLEQISDRLNVTSLPPIFHVHGSLRPDDQIILGIELEDISKINNQLTFLIKSNNPQYHYNHLLRDLASWDNVIFFGHSINGMDFPYFKDYFINLSSIPVDVSEKKHITIITYDELSAMEIKDNFRRNGIDVRNLFNRVEMEFIMTKSIYDGNKREIAKFDKLKSKISILD